MSVERDILEAVGRKDWAWIESYALTQRLGDKGAIEALKSKDYERLIHRAVNMLASRVE